MFVQTTNYLCPEDESGFFLDVTLNAELNGVDQTQAEALVAKAHTFAPTLRRRAAISDGGKGLSAGIRSASRGDRRGHPASLASQTSGEDSARIGNHKP
jgi:hypothetical protein